VIWPWYGSWGDVPDNWPWDSRPVYDGWGDVLDNRSWDFAAGNVRDKGPS
jgi:hypothetical protein